MVKTEQEENIESEIAKVVRKPNDKQNKLRSLTKQKVAEQPKIEKNEEPKSNRKLYGIALTAVIAAFIYFNISISSCGFLATYENNFNKIVHGDEKYCYRPLDPAETYEQLQKQVIGQEDALRLIKGSLGLVNRERIIQIAMFGSTGSGKTLSSNLIMKNFKWKRNIISTIFDINFQVNLTGQEAFDSDLKEIEPNLSDCGFNLLVIDDVDTKPATIQRINELERNLHRRAKQELFKVVMIVIFNGNVDTEKLKNFVTIEFEAITEQTFLECIEIHQKLRGVKLKPAAIEELKMINFTSTGCKTVAKKINLMAEN